MALRIAGFFTLGAALVIDLLAAPVGQGAIYWCGHLTVGAILTVFALEVRKRASAKR